MSRLTTLSPEAIRAVFSTESDADLILLLSIYDPNDPNTVSVRLADNFTQRLEGTGYTTDDEVIYGVVSRNQNFIYLPMEITLPTEEEAQAPRCSVIMHDVTQYIVPIVRSLTGPPKVKLELVLSSSPNVVEASFSGFYISNITYNKDSITADLSMIDYEREPFPMHSFTPAYFPGLF